MKKTRLALIGAGGYGAYYLDLLDKEIDPASFELRGVIDPFASRSPRYEKLVERKIPIYDTLADFYAADSAELVCVASPIPFHEEQCREAFRNGSYVLCEKPIAATVQSALRMRSDAEAAGKPSAIGFQWSYCPTMRGIKADILAGKYGAPKRLKTFISWPRGDSYYVGSWHGNLRMRDGSFILDSVVSNATAHYLHNMFFLLGDKPDSAATPSRVRAELYRGKPIESFDTCFLSGDAGGAEFWFGATHSGETISHPRFVYEFEDAEVTFDQNVSPDVFVRYRDGRVENRNVRVENRNVRVENCGDPQCDASNAAKIKFMLACASGESDETPPCTVDTALPHLRVCNMALDTVKIAELPRELRFREGEFDFVRGLYADALKCYEASAMPSDAGCAWSVKGAEFDPRGYNEFTGALI